VIERLRDELRRITSEARVMAEACRFRRVPDPSTRFATTLLPTVAEAAAARENHQRLLRWCDAVLSVLRRRGIACAELQRAIDELSPLVLLQRRDVATIPRPRWRREFDDSLNRAAMSLERLLAKHAHAFLFPRLQPKAQDVLRLCVETGRGTWWRIFATAMDLEAEEIVAAPFAAGELRGFFEQHCQPDAGDPLLVAGMDPMRAFGQRLHRTLFSGCVGALYERVHRAAVQSGRELRLEVAAFGDECRAVPWETLYDGVRFLSTASDVLVSRSAGRISDLAPAPLPLPLRILLTVGSPQGVDVIDASGVRRTIEVALAPLVLLGLVELDVSADGSMDGLRRCLRSAEDEGRPHHVWHFVGHGEYDSGPNRDDLILSRRGGEAHSVTTSELGAMFVEHPRLHLVVLNACREGADVRDRSWKSATELIEAGVPMVVAMQFEFSYAAASVFDAELYGSIADGSSVDQAIVAARRALLDVPNYAEWITPVIFHGGSGRMR
jgi:hypothetical protein